MILHKILGPTLFEETDFDQWVKSTQTQLFRELAAQEKYRANHDQCKNWKNIRRETACSSREELSRLAVNIWWKCEVSSEAVKQHFETVLLRRPAGDMKGKEVKFTLELAMMAQKGSRGIAKLVLNSALYGGGWLTPRSTCFTPGRDTRYPWTAGDLRTINYRRKEAMELPVICIVMRPEIKSTLCKKQQRNYFENITT